MIAGKMEKLIKGLDALPTSFFLKAIFLHAVPAEQIWSSFPPECLQRWLQLYLIPPLKNGGH